LPRSAKPRLEALAKALLERPALKLEITGQADSESDPEGLKRARLDSKLRALKSEGAKKGDADAAVETIDMDSEEYPELLERVYRDEDFEKPRNVLGIAKNLPVEEMETLILANTVLDEQDLRDLADRRAKAVRDWLLVEKVPAERLFLHPAEIVKADDSAESESSGQDKGNRVAFSLQ
jgi:hypothetical protein